MIRPVPKPVKQAKEKKRRKMKKTPEQTLKERIDDIDSMICLIVNDFTCILCGSVANQTHHFFHKAAHGAVRFDPDNHCPMDYGCHNYVVHLKGDTEDLRDNLILRIGQYRFDLLKVKSKIRADMKIGYLKEELERKKQDLRKVAICYPERLCKLSDSAKVRFERFIK